MKKTVVKMMYNWDEQLLSKQSNSETKGRSECEREKRSWGMCRDNCAYLNDIKYDGIDGKHNSMPNK